MALPLYILAIPYLLVLLFFIIFSFFSLYHLFRYGLMNFTTISMGFLYIALAAFILFVSWTYLKNIEWHETI
jgi:hypothetical protein